MTFDISEGAFANEQYGLGNYVLLLIVLAILTPNSAYVHGLERGNGFPCSAHDDSMINMLSS